MSFQDREYFKKYSIAAEQGDSNAQFMLACAYFVGKGTNKSYEKYQFWLACAYVKGDSRAIKAFEKLYVGQFAALRKRFLTQTCPYVIRNFPQYVPHYQK